MKKKGVKSVTKPEESIVSKEKGSFEQNIIEEGSEAEGAVPTAGAPIPDLDPNARRPESENKFKQFLNWFSKKKG